jgi:hypothetical protein
VVIEPPLGMAFGTCERLAPKAFVIEKDKMFNLRAKVIIRRKNTKGTLMIT